MYCLLGWKGLFGWRHCRSSRWALKKASKFMGGVGGGTDAAGLMGGRTLLKEAGKKKDWVFCWDLARAMLVVRWHVGTDNRWATRWQNVEQDNRIPIIISADQGRVEDQEQQTTVADLGKKPLKLRRLVFWAHDALRNLWQGFSYLPHVTFNSFWMV